MLYPISKIRITAGYRFDDKVGKLDANHSVGQKEKVQSGGIQITTGDGIFDAGLSSTEFVETNVAHDGDGLSLYAGTKQDKNLFAAVSVNNKDYDPAMINAGKTLEINNTDFSGAYNFSNNLSLSSVFSKQERNNTNAGSLSFEDTYFSTSLNISSRLGKAAVTYKNVDRDFTGGAINTKTTKSFRLKASTDLTKFLGFKLDYTHGYNDVSGISNLGLTNFDEFSGEFRNQKLSFNLIGFKKFSLEYYEIHNYKNYNPIATQGTMAYKTNNSGFTSTYLANDSTTLNMSYYTLESRMVSRQKFWRDNAGTGLADNVDLTFAIDYDTTLLQLGAEYQLMGNTTLCLDYLLANSSLADLHQDNMINERELGISLQKELNKRRSLKAGVTRNYYDDRLDSTTSDKSTAIQFELINKF